MAEHPTAADFDEWYSEMDDAPRKEEIVQRHLGLPPHLLSTSLLTWEGIAEVCEALQLESGALLVDLACGRGGYGLEIAHRTGARLVGVDFSPVAVQQAAQHASTLGRTADFRVGDLTATGLADRSADAAMCIDAIQFARPADSAYREIHRILRPGGRAVLTCWQTSDPDDESVPRRLLDVDLHGGLAAAGFSDIVVSERPEWQRREVAMWEEAAALDPGDDPALRSLHEEGVRVLSGAAVVRRLIASAAA